MSSPIVTALLWTAALSSGLIAGVYLAFSGFIMQALGKINPAQAIAAMNSINETILRSLFMPLFFASSFVSLCLVIVAFARWGKAGTELALLAGVVYFVGMFVCTILFNVPLNNSLVNLDPNSANANQVWSRYLKIWTNWNHLRTVSSLVTCILCVWLLSNY